MIEKNKKTAYSNQGSIIISVLVFSAVFIILVSALNSYVFQQNRFYISKENRETAIQIAEAGLDYYKWFLSHYPDDLQDGTGGAGPYEHEYFDPEGGSIGKFSLEIEGDSQCGVVSAVNITSTGWTYNDPSKTREVYGRYAQPSVAEYAYIINSNVWAGSSRVIKGRYHTNGGVRMDGENQSLVTSAVEDWLCTSSFGCSPSQSVDGVFGSGIGSDLWQFPVAQIDFAGITLDLVSMKAKAQSDGLYFGPSGRQGYHLIFQNDDTVDVYRVRQTRYVWGYSSEDGWERDYHIIRTEDFVGTYDIPSDCSLIFVEDDLWIDGEISGKVNVASANLIHSNTDTDVILNDNITYTHSDGTSGLTLVAENSILIPLLSPNDMEINGIFIAQKGHFGRNHYNTWYTPYSYWSYITRNTLEMHGSVVSNGRVGTSWSCGGSFCSGYSARENTYDRKLAVDPPPLTPFVSDDYRFIEWREE